MEVDGETDTWRGADLARKMPCVDTLGRGERRRLYAKAELAGLMRGVSDEEAFGHSKLESTLERNADRSRYL